MGLFFLDSSALVKRYLRETGTPWIRNLTDPSAGNTIILAEITRVEVAAALAARHRAMNGISLEERDEAVALLLKHCDAEYRLTSLNRAIIGRAVTLTQTHRLRGYDAVQLATALAVDDSLSESLSANFTFVAADGDLILAARTEGMAAEDPNNHG